MGQSLSTLLPIACWLLPEKNYFCGMKIIDTHNHIYLPDFDADRDEVIKRSVDAGVVTVMTQHRLLASVAPMLAAEKSTRKPYACRDDGTSPYLCQENYLDELENVVLALRDHGGYGIGEYAHRPLLWTRACDGAGASFRRHPSWRERYGLLRDMPGNHLT